MPSTHQPYPPEYQRRIIELARAGRSITELAREFEPTAETIRQWVKQAALDDGQRRSALQDLLRADEPEGRVLGHTLSVVGIHITGQAAVYRLPTRSVGGNCVFIARSSVKCR